MLTHRAFESAPFAELLETASWGPCEGLGGCFWSGLAELGAGCSCLALRQAVWKRIRVIAVISIKLHGLLRAAAGKDLVTAECGVGGIALEQLLSRSGIISKTAGAGVPPEYWTIVIDGNLMPYDQGGRETLVRDGSVVDLFIAVEGG